MARHRNQNRRVMRVATLLLIAIMAAQTSLFGQRGAVFGEKAPSISIEEFVIDNRAAAGKTTYIEFFKADSPHSISQLEHLARFASRYGAHLNFIVLSLDSREKLERLFQSHDIPYSVARDSGGKSFKQYSVEYTPTSILIDRKGNYVWRGRSSELSERTILNAIERTQR